MDGRRKVKRVKARAGSQKKRLAGIEGKSKMRASETAQRMPKARARIRLGTSRVMKRQPPRRASAPVTADGLAQGPRVWRISTA